MPPECAEARNGKAPTGFVVFFWKLVSKQTMCLISAVFTCFPDLKKLGVKAFGSEFWAKLFQILDPENGVETSRENRIEPAKEISVEESAGSFSPGRVS